MSQSVLMQLPPAKARSPCEVTLECPTPVPYAAEATEGQELADTPASPYSVHVKMPIPHSKLVSNTF